MQNFIIEIKMNMENIGKVIEEVKKGEFLKSFHPHCRIECTNHNNKKAFFTITVHNFDGNDKKYSMCAELIDMNIDKKEDDYEIIQEIINKNVYSVEKQINLNQNLSSCDYFINHINNINIYSVNDENSQCASLYYILEIYEYSQTLADEIKGRIYNENEIKEIINSVCNALKFCHNK